MKQRKGEQNKYPHVPYGLTVHGEEEIKAVIHVLRTSTQMGEHVRKMEEKVAALFDKRHGIMVNSGSSALLLAMRILKLPAGSEVITPALTFSTTVTSLVMNNLVPAFVDVQEGTYCLDPKKIDEMISPKTKAILAPHLIGNIVNWDEVLPIARKHNLYIIEDSADTLGARLHDKSSGHHTDISATSFYGSHVINCAGNGGMLCVNSDELANSARLFRSWGRRSSLFVESEAIENRFNIDIDGIPYDAKFVFDEMGYNLEPSELGAAFGLIQLSKLQNNIEQRVQNFEKQNNFFKAYEDWFILPQQTSGSHTGWLAYPLTLRDNIPFTRRELQIFLEKRNIQTRVVFTGNIIRQPGFRAINMCKTPNGYPEADKVMAGGMLLACHHGLTDEMIGHVHESFQQFASQFT